MFIDQVWLIGHQFSIIGLELDSICFIEEREGVGGEREGKEREREINIF